MFSQRWSWCFIAPVLLAGCAILPNGGPTARAILEGNATSTQASNIGPVTPDYEVIEVTPAVIGVLNANEPHGFIGAFGQGHSGLGAGIGVGDTVGVTVYEATTGGLFGTGDAQGNGSKSVTLPPQQVDASGHISVPFAGRVMAGGRTPSQVQTAIVNALRGKAIDPQAIVSITQNGSRFVSVSGEVGQGGRFPITGNSDRVLDAIALAGGPRSAAYQIYVRLTRGQRSSLIKLDSLISQPAENIHLSPGDQIFLYHKPQSFTVLGALARNANIDFDTEKISLAEGLGKASGLIDQRSDPNGVFVFRFESAQTLNEAHASSSPRLNLHSDYPVVYHVNLRDARGLFLSQSFNIRDKDIVYVSTAPATDLQKFLSLLGAGVGTATGGSSTISLVR